jgi:hypothetical protein
VELEPLIRPQREGWFSTLAKVTAVALGAIYSLFPTSASSSNRAHQVVVAPVPNQSQIEQVRKWTDQYPEISWLANADVRKTEEAQASLQGTYSEQLFGEKFVEFDRTIMTLRCLHLILDGSETAYQEFTKAQPEEIRLSRESFKGLHAQGAELSDRFGMQAMEAALVLGDIGKSEKARAIFKSYGAKAPDHDDFHGEVMQILQEHPTLCPTFDRLPPAAKALLSQTANLAHYGHITHLEGGPSMFSKLKDSGVLPEALAFDFFVHTCDVAGALGHVNNQSSLVYTEQSHWAMQAVAKACKELITKPQMTEMDAYNAYLTQRAVWLNLNGMDRLDRALTRMGAMLRLFTSTEGEVLKKSILKLPAEDQAKITTQLNAEEGRDLERTPTYMPAVLVNLANNLVLGSSKEERLEKAVQLGLPFLARVLEQHKRDLKEGRAIHNIPLNFNKAAGVAKATPNALLSAFTIDQDGNVLIL